MRTILAALTVLLLAPAAASAARLEVTRENCKGCPSTASLRLTAAPGERNDIRVTTDRAANRVTITDAGAPLTGDCAHPEPHTAVCPYGGVSAELGDGDDVIAGAGSVQGGDGHDIVEQVSQGGGGPGNDRLSSDGSGYASLSGDEGDDVLLDGEARARFEPGPGRDVVLAGGGPDVVFDADSEPDRLDGGGGSNVLSLFPRMADGFVDLSTRTTGDGDAIAGFDGAAGGYGDDVLIGHDGDNSLYGEAGEDELLGGAGQDVLQGGAGFDTYDGGPGYDQIFAASPTHSYDSRSTSSADFDAVMEPIACGAGRDDVASFFGDVIGPDCERVHKRYLPRPVRIRGRRVTLQIPCFALAGCRGVLRVAEPAQSYMSGPVPQKRFRIRGRSGRVTVRLPTPYCTCEAHEITIVSRQYRERTVSRWILPAVR